MPLQLGDPKSLAITITNAAGDEADPTALTLTIEKPDGTVDGPYTWPTPAEITRDGAGLFSYTYVPADAGHYVARWVATGSNASAYEEAFDVDEAYGSVGIVGIDDVRRHLANGGLTVDDYDELNSFIAAATRIVEGMTGPIIRRSVTETLYGQTGSNVLLGTYPVLSVESVDVASYGVSSASYDDTQVTLLPWGAVQVTDGTRLHGDVTVTYMVGRSVVAEDIELAVKECVRLLWAKAKGMGATEYPVSLTTTDLNDIRNILGTEVQGPAVA